MQNSGVFAALSDQVMKTIVDFTRAGMEELPPTHRKLFKQKNTTNRFERMTSIAPFGNVPAKAEGADYSFDVIQPGYSKDIAPVEYGLGFLYTETAQEDDNFEVLSQHSRWLGFSARVLEEQQAARVFNNAFTTQTTADGLSLCNTAHTLKRGGTTRNRLATDADPSPASLAQMRSDMRTQTKLESGQLVRPSKKVYLVHHPDQEWLVHRLVKSKGLPLTSDNDTNPANDLMDIEPLTWEYIEDADSWFMVAQNTATHGLVQLNRIKPKVNAPRQIAESGNWIVSIRLREHWDSFDWRNVAGTSGG